MRFNFVFFQSTLVSFLYTNYIDIGGLLKSLIKGKVDRKHRALTEIRTREPSNRMPWRQPLRHEGVLIVVLLQFPI